MERIEINCTYNECCKITMKRMPDKYLSLIFTSPPYFQQRAYEAEHQIFDEVKGCKHLWIGIGSASNISTKRKSKTEYGYVCYNCSAYKTQLGTEKFLNDTEIEFEMMEIRDDLTVEELKKLKKVLEELK